MSKLGNLSKLARTYGAYIRRDEVCRYPPTRIWVEATSHCNLHCSFCGNKQLSKDERGFMDIGLFRKIADEASGRVHQFNLFHRGESLLHPRIGELIRYAGSRGIQTRINTNGTKLISDLGRELIESQLDILSFSFDGYDRDMYESNRKGASYDNVLSNILDFLILKMDAGAAKPFVALELMEFAECPPAELAQKRRRFLKRFEGLPLDKFIIRRPHNWAGAVEVGSGGRGRWLVPKRVPCPLLWHALVVFWDGRVMPCPQDFFGMLQLGDLTKESLMDIWNGMPIRNLRREMAQVQSLERSPCVNCDRIMRATVAGVPVDYLGRFLSEAAFGNGWLRRLLPH